MRDLIHVVDYCALAAKLRMRQIS